MINAFHDTCRQVGKQCITSSKPLQDALDRFVTTERISLASVHLR